MDVSSAVVVGFFCVCFFGVLGGIVGLFFFFFFDGVRVSITKRPV